MAGKLSDVDLFLLDMDGTVFLGDAILPGALEFIRRVTDDGKHFVFLTNNSSQNATGYVAKLNRLGIACGPEHVFTSGMAMGMHLTSARPGCKVHLVGTTALAAELRAYGVRLAEAEDYTADTVVVGFDKELTYAKLEKACTLIHHGAAFLATNVDFVCPMGGGEYVPDCGSICKLLGTATGVEPRFIGKPSRDMVDILSGARGLANSRVAVVGDRLYTDIAAGVNAGAVTVLVLSGETTTEILQRSDVVPDYVLGSIGDIVGLM